MVLRCFQWIRAKRTSKSQTPSSREAPSSKFQIPRVKYAGQRSGCAQTDERYLITATLELGIWSFPGAWGLELGALALSVPLETARKPKHKVGPSFFAKPVLLARAPAATAPGARGWCTCAPGRWPTQSGAAPWHSPRE